MTLVSRKYLGAVMAAMISGGLLALPLSVAAPAGWLSLFVPIALVPLFIAVERLPVQAVGGIRTYHKAARVSGFGRGFMAFGLFWIAGATFSALAFSWTTVALLRETDLTHPSVYAIFIAYCLLAGLYFPLVFSPFIVNAGRCAKKQLAPFPIWAMAVLTTAIEIWVPKNWAWTFGSLADFSYAINQWASLFGLSALTPFVVGGGAYLARSISGITTNALRSLVMVFSLILLWIVIFGLGEWRLSVMDNRVEGIRKTRVGVIFSGGYSDKIRRERHIDGGEQKLETLLQMTQQLLAEKTGENKLEMVIWPKDELPEGFSLSNEQQEKVRALSRQTDVPILVAADEFDLKTGQSEISTSTRAFKSAFLFRPDGSKSENYRQRFLTPFEESLPFEDSFPSLAKFLRKRLGFSHRWVPGDSFVSLPYSPDFRVGLLLSFDAMHSEVSMREAGRSEDADHGEAGILVHSSSFASIVGTNAPRVLQSMARWRGIETGRSLISVGAAGYLWAFDPLGRTVAFEGTRDPASYVVEVPAFDPDTVFDTFYSEFGSFPFAIVAFISLLAVFFTLFRRVH